MTPELEARMAAANAAIETVQDRYDRPSPYRSYAEYWRTLADAYRARAAVWIDVIKYTYEHPDTAPLGIAFDALVQARSHNEESARDCDREARRAELNDEQAQRAALKPLAVLS